ncbi:uncharacterized protein LOC106672933 isoform X1 [Cimex lectularius]|uniref:Zinc finger protein 541 n=3 Tax=Cimex lectularius TaxID=79782 RepID=A0A8I6SBM2_CIMLE|nr:uncharacterized protein LOC106672933 isoform X1 [Cimex lectularius]
MGVGEVRLEGGFGSSPSRTVFMYSATTTPGEPGVTLQLREPETSQEKTELNSVLARIQQEEAAAGSLSLSYHDPDIITDGSIDVLLGANTISTGGGDSGPSGFEIFDSESGQELTLSPQTFANTEAFINDSSGSPGVSGPDNDTVESSEEGKGSSSDSSKLTVKKPRPKASSPNRQGPQKCPILTQQLMVCNKVFGNASALAKHKLTHSDERKYVCTMCGKAFKRQDHLNGHMLTHRNKKPYECKAEGCGKSYCDARSLRRHTENHHAGITSNHTLSPANRDDGSPQSCIQYAPPPSYSSPAPPASSGSTVNGQTKPVSQLQQLLASEPANTVPFGSRSSNSQNNNDGLTKQQIDLIHQIMQQTQHQAVTTTASTHPKCPSASSITSSTTSLTKQKNWTVQTSTVPPKCVTTSKPVECNLCHRKFKNIPALNGHMRLHGGYFKKDSDTKKCEKKDLSGPPLQTASISVRALIEEKIIQKRTNPSQNQSINIAAQQTSDEKHGTENTSLCNGNSTDAESNTKNSSFLVPTPSLSSKERILEKSIETTSLDSNECGRKLDGAVQKPSVDHPILKKAPKLSVKRASSDPGIMQPSINETSRQLQLNLSTDPTYSLGVYSEDAGYFSPTLQDDVFQQVDSVQESMILQGVDPSQLAESIQAATLHDIASLEGYTSPTESLSSPQSFQRHQDLQSVLDSPLPISLADFAYTHSQHTNNDSALPVQSPYVTSPLPSPCFTYPTPPASQEGHSPSFPPMQPVIPGNVSSPLSAAFYTTTMSSSAAVEAALNEVLPQHNYPSPPPQSPTPVSSPLSTSAPSTSPLPHHPLQSQMMPNSDDPLLSSSPKDFASRKKFDFHTFKLLHNGTFDFGSAGTQGVTGIVLDRNGELKLIQTSCFQSMKTGLINGTTIYLNTKRKAENITSPDNKSKLLKAITIPAKSINSNKLYKANGILLENNKEDAIEEDVFLSPSIPTSPLRMARKRLRLENPAFSKPPYHSRLRKVRKSEPNEQLPYTPTPLLPPTRYGQGLYWQTIATSPCPSTVKEEADVKELLYESDSVPHINIGPEYQCSIPPCLKNSQLDAGFAEDQLLWESSLNEMSNDSEIDMYLEFACCAAVPGGGRNKEYALHVLHLCHGKIHEAMLKLMQPTPCLPADHPLLSFEYADSERWTSNEMEAFHQAVFKFDKDFILIAQEIGSKTVPQCVQFYYIWKKVCPEDYKKLRMVRRRFRDSEREIEVPKSEINVNDAELVSTSSESRLFVCEYADCSASFNSRAALNGHIRIHVGGTSGRSPTPDKRSANTGQQNNCEPSEEFPCKICGKIFNKVKSRSAHMKSHRPPDAEIRKPKTDSAKMEGTEPSSGKGVNLTTPNSTQRNS